MGYPAGCLPESSKPLGLELLLPSPFQRGGHLSQRSSESLELRCATAGTVRRQRFHSANVPGPADQLLDRSTELAGEMPAEPKRCIDESSAQEKNEKAQPGVVIATERLRALKLSDRGVELACVVRQCTTLGGSKAGRIDRMQ